MKIVVIGSINVSENEFRAIEESFGSIPNHIEVIRPFNPSEDDVESLLDLQRSYVRNIANADLVIAVPKHDRNKPLCQTENGLHKTLVFGESSSYEIAIAKYFNKPVVYWSL